MNTDVWLAIGVCVFVAIMFSATLLVPRSVRPARSTDTKIDDVGRQIADLDRRLTASEHDIKNVRMAVGGLATKDHVSRVEVQVAELRGDMKALIQATASTAHVTGRIEEFLLRTAVDAIAHSNKGTETKG